MVNGHFRQLADWLHLHFNLMAVQRALIVHVFLVFSVVLNSGCGSSKKLVSVLVEDKQGNTELIYEGSQSPDNLVKEIKYYPTGDTLSITPMKNGAIHGMVTRFGRENKLKEQITFIQGKQDGVFKRFDSEGVLVFEGQLLDGKKNGIWTTWYDEVQKEEERGYSKDQPNGKWTYWYIDGSLKREETYKDGKLIDEKNYN